MNWDAWVVILAVGLMVAYSLFVWLKLSSGGACSKGCCGESEQTKKKNSCGSCQTNSKEELL